MPKTKKKSRKKKVGETKEKVEKKVGDELLENHKLPDGWVVERMILGFGPGYFIHPKDSRKGSFVHEEDWKEIYNKKNVIEEIEKRRKRVLTAGR